MVGYLFFLLTLCQPRVCFRRVPVTLLWFGAYMLIYCLFGILINSYYPSLVRERLFTLIQMLVLFWASYNLLRDPKMVAFSIGALAAACAVLATLQLTGATSVTYRGMIEGRTSAFNENPNVIGSLFSLGLISLVGLVYGRFRTTSRLRHAIWGMLPVLALALVRTGARAALVGLATGLFVFVLARGSVQIKIRNAIVVLLALGVLLATLLTSRMSVERWKMAFEQKSMAGREEIFPEAWKMFLEKPLIGWGPINHYYELGWRMESETKDTHNLVLWVLTEVGLLGSFPFFAGIYLCLRSAWRARNGPHGVLPLALTMTLLVVNLSGTGMTRKVFWIVLAYASASGVQVLSRNIRRPATSRISAGCRPSDAPGLNSLSSYAPSR